MLARAGCVSLDRSRALISRYDKGPKISAHDYRAVTLGLQQPVHPERRVHTSLVVVVRKLAFQTSVHYAENALNNRSLLDAVIGAIPGLVIALCIFLIARGVSAFSKGLVERLASTGSIAWLSQETLQPTTRLISLAIWLFAFAMAYPYLPGADTEAFKGLSVLIGLMISLGASSVVGQAAAGLILTYTRTLRVGEFVRIGEHEGTVTELGMFTTAIRTGQGEVLTIPNTMITGAVTKNYSRIVQGTGYLVDTTVTIGYDTPWRQVEAMLLEAATRTPGIVQTPQPRVFQTALSDFYPEYRLVAHAVPTEPKSRAELLTALHANIQDVFNEYGVQIMSPHYVADPEQSKWVPRDQWFTSPADRVQDKESSND